MSSSPHALAQPAVEAHTALFSAGVPVSQRFPGLTGKVLLDHILKVYSVHSNMTLKWFDEQGNRNVVKHPLN
eukprot:13671696-Alexandrium_andersonii.AAC.1